MVFIGILILTTLSIAGSAAFFSIYGLAQIFMGSFWPVVVMASSLEAGKLVAASYAYRYWNDLSVALRTYLITAIIVLMFITSAGIFGFLSRAHIEQTAASDESVAQIHRLESEISRQQSIIDRADDKIKQLETSGTSADASIQQQLDKEQARLDAAYQRVQSAEEKAAEKIKPFQEELKRISTALNDLQVALNNGEIKQAQGIVGTKPDGIYGSRTITKIDEFRDEQNARQKELLAKIDEIQKEGSAGVELARSQMAESNKIISRLSAQLGKGTSVDLDAIVDEQQSRIEAANVRLEQLLDEKFELESTVRQLEAEVGPIKYLAAFFVGETDRTTLERAVSWLIIVIIFAFDPLAVTLTVCANIAIIRRQKELYGDIEDYEYEYEYEDDDEPNPTVTSLDQLALSNEDELEQTLDILKGKEPAELTEHEKQMIKLIEQMIARKSVTEMIRKGSHIEE